MLGDARPRGGPLRPASAAGLILLALAAVLLVLGRVVFAGNPVQFEDAIVAIGLAVLAGASLATFFGTSTVPGPTADSRGPRTGEVAAAAPSDRPPSSSRPSAPAVDATTSIPASYVAAMYASPPDVAGPPDDPGPIPAALPFAALPRPSGTREAGPAETPPSLDVELARLRARVHELEAGRGLDTTPAWYAARSGASRDLSPLAVAANGPVRPLAGGPGRCVGCGIAVGAQTADSLCGNCGRPLCEGCGGPTGLTAGLRRCPECRAGRSRSAGVAISGGRAPSDAAPVGPGGPSRPG